MNDDRLVAIKKVPIAYMHHGTSMHIWCHHLFEYTRQSRALLDVAHDNSFSLCACDVDQIEPTLPHS